MTPSPVVAALAVLLQLAVPSAAEPAGEEDEAFRRRAEELLLERTYPDARRPLSRVRGVPDLGTIDYGDRYLRTLLPLLQEQADSLRGDRILGGAGLRMRLSGPWADSPLTVGYLPGGTFATGGGKNPRLYVLDAEGQVAGQLYALEDGRLVRAPYPNPLNDRLLSQYDVVEEGGAYFLVRRDGEGGEEAETRIPLSHQPAEADQLASRSVDAAETERVISEHAAAADGLRPASEDDAGPEDPFARSDDPEDPFAPEEAPAVRYGGLGEAREEASGGRFWLKRRGADGQDEVLGWDFDIGGEKVMLRAEKPAVRRGAGWDLGPQPRWRVYTLDGRTLLGGYRQVRAAAEQEVFEDGRYIRKPLFAAASSAGRPVYSDLKGGRYVRLDNGAFLPMPEDGSVALAGGPVTDPGSEFSYERRWRDRWGRVHQQEALYRMDPTGRTLYTQVPDGSGARWVPSKNELYFYDPASGYVFNGKGFPVGAARDPGSVSVGEDGFLDGTVEVVTPNMAHRMTYHADYQWMGGKRVLIRAIGEGRPPGWSLRYEPSARHALRQGAPDDRTRYAHG